MLVDLLVFCSYCHFLRFSKPRPTAGKCVCTVSMFMCCSSLTVDIIYDSITVVGCIFLACFLYCRSLNLGLLQVNVHVLYCVHVLLKSTSRV
jgi:hypothetical protein